MSPWLDKEQSDEARETLGVLTMEEYLPNLVRAGLSVPRMCATLRDDGRSGLKDALTRAGVAVRPAHPRPRTMLINHLEVHACVSRRAQARNAAMGRNPDAFYSLGDLVDRQSRWGVFVACLVVGVLSGSSLLVLLLLLLYACGACGLRPADTPATSEGFARLLMGRKPSTRAERAGLLGQHELSGNGQGGGRSAFAVGDRRRPLLVDRPKRGRDSGDKEGTGSLHDVGSASEHEDDEAVLVAGRGPRMGATPTQTTKLPSV